MKIEKLTPAQAVEFARTEHDFDVEISTMRLWCHPNKFNIGVKIGGRLYVIKKRLIWVLEGQQWKIIQEDKRQERNQ